MNPLVSILIPSYNHAHFIIETLNSVVADTYTNKEIVLIDDGSKDNSVAVIENWIAENPTENLKFKSRQNKGLTFTLNELVNNALGNYLIVLASDDLLTNNTIASRVRILQESGKKVLLSDAEVINDKGVTLYKSMLSDFHKADKNNYSTYEGILDEIIFKFSISGAVIIMDKDIFSLIGKYPEDLVGEDLYFYIKVASINELLFYDKIVSKYRLHDSNTSGVNPKILISNLKTYFRLFFSIPGPTRKLKLAKRIVGTIVYNPKNAMQLFAK
jgi:glycosyltransferase involved in cell wall biosynthesis